MSTYIAPTGTISEAWLRTLEAVQQAGGRQVNVLATATTPLAEEDAEIRSAVDALLVPAKRGQTVIQSVDTVANTIFPRALYRDPGINWAPDLGAETAARLDSAATDLYHAYVDMLPLLCTADGNSRGTYFGRMISWPGKDAGGTNQLADRVKYLRSARRNGHGTQNVSDIALGGEAEHSYGDASADLGLQVYAATDRRQRGFPCLVHADFTLFEGRLNLLAVYRHQYLITKAYGNLLGLARLLGFLAQQTGFEVGELAVQATFADAERSTYGGKSGVDTFLRSARPTMSVQ